MPHITVLFGNDPSNSRFGYAVDIVVLKIENTASEAVAAAPEEVNRIIQRVSENVIELGLDKTELLVIGGGPEKKFDTSGLFIQMNGYRIPSSPVVRWLRVWLDSQLNFKQHVQKWCGKAQSIANFLRRTNSVQRGAALGLLIKAVQLCVLNVVCCELEAWWPGQARIATVRGVKVGTGTSWHSDLLGRTILQAIRAALPVWRTTPTIALHRESRIPPTEIILQHKKLEAVARTQRLDT